jgi:hypothetical protein
MGVEDAFSSDPGRCSTEVNTAAVFWALRQKLRPRLQYVLIALAEDCDSDGNVTLDICDLTQRTGRCRASVLDNIRKLEALGLLKRKRQLTSLGGSAPSLLTLMLDDEARSACLVAKPLPHGREFALLWAAWRKSPRELPATAERAWRKLTAGQRLSAYRELSAVRGGRQPFSKMTLANWLKDRGWEAHVEAPAQAPPAPAKSFVRRLGPDGRETPLWRALVLNRGNPLPVYRNGIERAEGWDLTREEIAAAEARIARENAMDDARNLSSRTAA